jgi:hypothetical protein
MRNCVPGVTMAQSWDIDGALGNNGLEEGLSENSDFRFCANLGRKVREIHIEPTQPNVLDLEGIFIS